MQFVCCDNPHANKATLQMMAVFAEFEREQISQRTKAAPARVKAELLNGPRISQAGRHYSKLGGPNLAKACERAAEIRRAVKPPAYAIDMMSEMRLAGHSYERIAAELNNRSIKTPQGFRWYASTARAVFLRLLPDIADPYESLNEAVRAAIPSVVPSNAGREATTEGKPPMQDINQALRMLDTFASVGARGFDATFLNDVTFLNIEGEKRGFRPQQSLMQVRNSLPKLLPGLAERQNSMAVRPSGDDMHFIQLDDLDTAALERLESVAFLTLATSPGNRQAWVAVSGHRSTSEEKELGRRLRKGVGADISASGATRIAGSPNYKLKYSPNFPMVTIVSAFPGRLVTPEQLQQLGLLAEPEPLKAPPLRVSQSGTGRTWPDYARCVASAPPNNAKDGPDVSRADFVWCLMALRRGQSVEDTAARLAELSSKARENGKGYALRTTQNAEAAVERERQRSRA